MPAPAVLPALATIAGIATGVLLPWLRSPSVAALVGAIVAAAVAWRAGRPRLTVALALLGFFAAGMLLGGAQISSATQSPLREFFDDMRAGAADAPPPVLVEGTLRADAVPTEYGAAMVVSVRRVRTPCGWLPLSGGLRVAVNGSLAAGLIDGWRAGRRVRVPVLLRLPAAFHDPGVPDEEFAMARRGLAVVGSAKSGALVEIVARGHRLAEAAAGVRAYARQAVAAALPGRPVAAAIVTAILVGDRGGLNPELQRKLQEAGTYHVIAISGGNVAILAGLAFVLLRLFRVPRRSGSLALAGVLCAYGYVAGSGPSVARATIAAAVYLLATAADHRSPALNVFASVALVAVLYEPLGVFDPGLLLSYGATLALLIGAERMLQRRRTERGDPKERTKAKRRRRHDGPRGVGQRVGDAVRQLVRQSLWPRVRPLGASALSACLAVFVGTLCAELALFPISATIFHRITLAGLALNFAAIPLMTVAQLAGLAVLALFPISTAFARGAGWIAASAADALTASTVLLDVAPWLTWRVPAPAPAIVATYYGAWAIALLPRTRRVLRRGAWAISAIAAILIAIPSLTEPVSRRLPGNDQLRVTFLDVGQGDSILVQFPGGVSMLVDAAGLPGSSFDLGERVITPALLTLGVRRLDYLAITHGDPDHVVGAPTVARDFTPREIWEGTLVPPHAVLQTLRAMVIGRGGAARLVRPDDKLQIGPVELRVLHPPEPDWERQRVRNDDSIVLELRYGDVSILLTGDIGAAVEESLISKLSGAPLRILKAAHHGSATSSAEAWLDAARPAAVVISCGRDNRYGHPAAAVLQRVAAQGAEIFRTDQDGAITVTTDGRSATVRTFTGQTSRLTTKVTQSTKVTKEKH